MKWYVLHVRTGCEDGIRNELTRQGYHAAVPTEIVMELKGGKWSEKLKILMPGYVFLQLQLTDEDFYTVRDIPGVIRFLGVGRPEPIRESEEDYIFWISNNGDPLGISEVLVEGDQVKIMGGPLSGREGSIVRLHRRQRRAVVAITIGGYRKEFSLSCKFLLTTKGGDA